MGAICNCSTQARPGLQHFKNPGRLALQPYRPFVAPKDSCLYINSKLWNGLERDAQQGQGVQTDVEPE